MSAKATLHHLVDLLPDEELSAANRFLQFLVDEAAIARGEFTPLTDLKRELGL